MSNEIFKVSNEDIKSLCDFMGIKPVAHGPNSYSWRDGVYFSTHEESSEKVMANVCIYIGERKVRDWNFLMEVVEKIESIKKEGKDYYMYNVVIEQYLCAVIQNETGFWVKRVTSNSKMKAVYKCCVSFVKWYNVNVK